MACPEVCEGSGGPSGGAGMVGRRTRRSGRGRKAHLEIWKAHPKVQEG